MADRISRSCYVLPLALALLGGCSVGPNYRPPSSASLRTPERFVAPSPAVTPETDLAAWWTQFGDPVLSGLVTRALVRNLDVDAAVARLRQARAGVRAAVGAQLPSIGVSGSATRSIGRSSDSFVDPTSGTVFTNGGDTTLYRAGLDAAWETDLFGGLRRSTEAARADAAASEASLHDVQLSVAAEVGLNYVDARLAQARLKIARDNLASQDETLQIVGWRVQAGLVGSLDLEQARQLRAQTAASIPTLENSYTTALNRLSVLTGEAPGAVDATLRQPAPIPLPPISVGAGIPGEVIQRRPDIAAAERSLAAEVARIGVATAELYPALRLSGSFSGSDEAIGGILGQSIGSLVAAISAPIFEGGQIRARIEGQRASADAALAAYRSAVLVALEEVENALRGITAAEQRERELVVADQASRNATLLARLQYRSGLIDFQTLLDAERSLLSSQDSRASARAARATATVQLYKALGGGWQAAPAPAADTYTTRR